MISSEPPLGSERVHLDAFRDATAMPHAARERVWTKLGAGPLGPIGGPVGGAAANDAGLVSPVGGEAGVVGAGRWGGRAGLVVGVSVAVITGVLVLALRGDPPADAVEPERAMVVADQTAQPPKPAKAASSVAAPKRVVDRPEPKLDPKLDPAEPSPSQAPLAPAKISERRAKPSAARAQAAAPPEPLVKTSLAEERRLIEQAHAALAKGNTAAALEVLDRHAVAFEAGVFVEEREALRVIAACTEKQSEQAASAAQRFLTRYPHAVLAARVRNNCGL